MPPTPASPVLPPEGEDQGCENLPPLGEVARRDVGGLVFFRLPREGGDPDPCTQAQIDPLTHALVGKNGERVDECPPLPTLSPSRAERAQVRALFGACLPARPSGQAGSLKGLIGLDHALQLALGPTITAIKVRVEAAK
jgi:hypothetical protein